MLFRSVDTTTQRIYKKAADGKESVVGIMANGKARRGFITPSRKFSIYHEDIEAAAKERGFTEDGGKGMPAYFPVPSIEKMTPDMLHLVTFKWNVHTQGRTASQKYLTEIVHHNPMWINADTAAKLGIKTGDLVEITTYRPYGHAMKDGGDIVGTALIPAYVTEGIHPKVLAVSNSLGNMCSLRVPGPSTRAAVRVVGIMSMRRSCSARSRLRARAQVSTSR